jgi:carbonic anhydrase/acetyltransferase-like protein (isoleucine patch superfamily)
VTVHVDPGFPASIGAGVSVGHNAVLHGCTIEDGCLIGMGAVVLNGARIGTGSLVAAGAVVAQGVVVPPGSLVAGVPGKVRRELSADEVTNNRTNAQVYEHLSDVHRTSVE